MLDQYLVDRIDASGDCWLWTGPKHGDSEGPSGYGNVSKRGPMRGMLAHRAVWSQLVGDPGPCLDHRCLNKLCVNPDHLEPVTLAENTRRQWPAKKTHCVHGHSDWRIKVDGWRSCRTCARERQRRGPT